MIAVMAAATIVVGIDEAGYGPILGPLVVSAAAFKLPVTDADKCLWKLLRRSVCQSVSTRGSRIAVLDSKKLYSRKDGLTRLERSVLSMVGTWRGIPPSLRGLLNLLCPDLPDMLCEYPWYRDSDPVLPMAADAGSIRIAAGLLTRDLDGRNIQSAGYWSEVLPEGHYNRLVSSTRNKAVVLSGLTLRLVQRIADAYPNHELLIRVDKQGARDHYGQLLMRAFEDRRLKIIEETNDSSVYEMVGGPARWRVSFTQSGESHHMPIALASLVSKYLRELLMDSFNAYWTSRVPNLKPTAGYYQDGQRFLRDIRPHLGRLRINTDNLVRQR